MIRKIPAAMLLTVSCVVAHGQGEKPVRSDATYEEKVDWLIEEVGTSEDGLTIRGSIDATDTILYTIIEQMATEEDVASLREEITALRKEIADDPPIALLPPRQVITDVDPTLSKKDIAAELPSKNDEKLRVVSADEFRWAIGILVAVFIAIATFFVTILFRHGVNIGVLQNKADSNSSNA